MEPAASGSIESASKPAVTPTTLPPSAAYAIPGLAVVFRVLGSLELIGGVVLCYLLWPEGAQAGYEWRTIAYIPALTWLTAGVIFGCLFFAVADILIYLAEIRDSVAKSKV